MNNKTRTVIACLVSAVLLVGMIATDATGVGGTHPGTDAYFERVSSTIAGVPLQTGPWLGVDIPVIPAAQELLRPNKVLQRRYTNADTGEWFELLIVHCGDVRDMLGHFPPVCYVANGWTLEQRTRVSVPLAGSTAGAMRYAFSREVDFVTEEIRIVNLFALPTADGEGFVPDYTTVVRAGRSRRSARLGSAQVQVIMPASMDADRRAGVVSVAMGLVESVMRDVERGPM